MAKFTSDQDHDTCVENGKKAGVASGKARREKKLFREAIEKQLEANIYDAMHALWMKAKQGDVQSAVFLRDTIGEKPSDKIENDVKMSFEDYLEKVEDEDEY